MKINIILSKTPTLYTENICTNYFIPYMENYKKFSNFFTNKSDRNKIIFLLNDYEYVAPNEFAMFNKVKIIKTGYKLFLIKDIINPKISVQSIIAYKPFTPIFFRNCEIIQKYKLFNNDIYNILEVSNTPNFFEAYEYIRKQNNTNKEINYNLDLFELKNEVLEEKDNLLDHYKQFIILNINNNTLHLDSPTLYKTNFTKPKFDLIYTNGFISTNSELNYEVRTYNSFNICVYGLYYSLLRLNKNGCIIFTIGEITHKRMADLVIFISSFFKKYYVYKWECHNNFKTTNCSVIYKYYNGNSIEELKKIVDYLLSVNNNKVPSSFINMIKVPSKRNSSIPNKYIDNTKNHITSLLDYKLDNPIYDLIKQHNEYVYFIKNNHMKMMINYMEMKDIDKDKFLIKYKKEQIMNAILYAKKWDFKTIQFNSDVFKKDFMKIIMQDMYIYYKPIVHKMNIYKINEPLISIPASFANANNILDSTDYIIDTRNVLEWNKMKKIIRFYRPLNKNKHLKKIIDVEYNQQNISQAWIKMYEILKIFKLISPKETKFTSFHMCEAPGNFISAINHYIKTETKISTFDWMAQSLNPKLDNDGFKDDYGYINKYTDRWKFGADDTGDITNIENIKFYRKYTLDRNIKLLTSDCGLHENCGYSKLTKVHIAQLLFILYIIIFLFI